VSALVHRSTGTRHCEAVDQTPVATGQLTENAMTAIWAPSRNSPNLAETPDFIAETPSNRRFRCRNPPE